MIVHAAIVFPVGVLQDVQCWSAPVPVGTTVHRINNELTSGRHFRSVGRLSLQFKVVVYIIYTFVKFVNSLSWKCLGAQQRGISTINYLHWLKTTTLN